jgi:hypothetical protein
MSEILHSAKVCLSTAILDTWKTMITTFLHDGTLMANPAQQGL